MGGVQSKWRGKDAGGDTQLIHRWNRQVVAHDQRGSLPGDLLGLAGPGTFPLPGSLRWFLGGFYRPGQTALPLSRRTDTSAGASLKAAVNNNPNGAFARGSISSSPLTSFSSRLPAPGRRGGFGTVPTFWMAARKPEPAKTNRRTSC